MTKRLFFLTKIKCMPICILGILLPTVLAIMGPDEKKRTNMDLYNGEMENLKAVKKTTISHSKFSSLSNAELIASD